MRLGIEQRELCGLEAGVCAFVGACGTAQRAVSALEFAAGAIAVVVAWGGSDGYTSCPPFGRVSPGIGERQIEGVRLVQAVLELLAEGFVETI